MRARALLGLALLPAAAAGCGGGHAPSASTGAAPAGGGGTAPAAGAVAADGAAPAVSGALARPSQSTELLGRPEPARRDPTLVRFVRTSGLYPRTDGVDIDRRGHVVVHTLPSGGRRRTVRLTLSARRFALLRDRLRRLQADPAPDADLDPRRYVYTVQVGARVARVFASGKLDRASRPALAQLNALVERAYRTPAPAALTGSSRER